MNKVIYMNILDLINKNFFDVNNLFENIDFNKMTICIDSILKNIQLKDIVIDNDTKHIIQGSDVIKYIYFYVQENIGLNYTGEFNYLCDLQSFKDLNSNLKYNFLSYTFRVISIDHEYIDYYKI